MAVSCVAHAEVARFILMSPRASALPRTLTLAVTVFASSCATTSAEPAAPTTATVKAQTPTDAEVVVLRERVARLEKRLADMDGKLSLLLARVENVTPGGPTPTQRVALAPPPRTTPQPTDDRVVVDLGSRGGSAGVDPLASVDIERGDVPIDDDGEAVVLRMRGDEPAVIEAAPSGAGTASDDDPLSALRSAKDLYAWGQARLKEARYVEAVAAFEDVLARFPSHDLADNSAYWIGHCHQRRGEHRLAIAEWQKLPARFPKSDKIADALYGMGESHEAIGEPVVAEVLYDELVASYPKAERYKDAKKALARLRPQH